MIRDPGPIHNIGFSVTSRDIPTNEGETEGVAPNSGFVARALNDHPIMRFFSATALTMVGAVAASRVTKSGGVRLAKYVQDRADDGSTYATSIVKSVTDIRRHLDELQGVSRQIDGVDDPYSKLIYKVDGTRGDEYVTGYEGVKSERFGYTFLTKAERQQAGGGRFNEPAAVWSFRDALQQRLVRAGRRLPYELPAMYGVQRGITDPLFGDRDAEDRKIKWYNPADVIADFTKQSVTNLATMILPFEFAGAAASAGRSSLHTLRYSVNDMRRLTGFKKTMHEGFLDANELLREVGHDFATLTDRFLRTSAQSSGALSAAADTFKNQTGLVQTLHSLRSGRKNAVNAARSANASKRQIKMTDFKATVFGYTDSSGQNYKGVLDLIPAFRGMRESLKVGAKEFKKTGYAYDAMENSVAFNNVLSNSKSAPFFKSQKDLLDSINRIQSGHKSRISDLATGLRILGGGGPGDKSFAVSDFAMGQKRDAFKDLIEQQLISSGVGKTDARQFVDYLKVTVPKSGSNATNIVSIGKTKIYGAGTTEQGIAEDFAATILKRYKGIKNGGAIEAALGQDAKKALLNAIEDAKGVYLSSDFQKNLKNSIQRNWNTFHRNDLADIASTVMKPQKAQYQDFVGIHNLSAAKQQFLQRKTAQVLGVPLKKTDGSLVADDVVNNALANKGFDPTNFTDLRAFLIKNRQMTSGVMGGGFNLFGLQSVTVNEAQSRGFFKHMRPQEQKIVNQLAVRQALDDPVSSSIGFSKLDGVYKTASGKFLDFTSVKSTFSRTANFFASEFQIPILGFNPADLFGYRSFSEMARRSPVQYMSGRDVQPFLGGQSRGDFGIWFKTGGTKGKIISYQKDQLSGAVFGRTLEGAYRGVPTNSVDLLSRQARLASGMEGETIDQIKGASRSRLKRRLSIDSEQPNSLFGLASRFNRRASDPGNPVVLSKLLRGEQVQYGSRKIRLNTTQQGVNIVDDTGNIVDDFIEDDILQAYDSLRRRTFEYGIPDPVMARLEAMDPQSFSYLGKTVGGLKSQSDIVSFAEEIMRAESLVAQRLKGMGYDPSYVLTSGSRIRNILQDADLTAVSRNFDKSPTINTRLDELKNEIFRYISQVNPMLNAGGGKIDMVSNLTNLQKAVDDLVAQGVISSAQRTEAQAAGLSTLFNISAFSTFKGAATGTLNARQNIAQLRQHVNAVPELGKLFDPFLKGEIGQVSSSIRKRFSPLISPLKRRFGVAPYEMDNLAVDPLGSSGGFTAVPTFGTTFGRDPFAAISSALGINTYSNPAAYSGASVPVAHSVERLNRYFGTLGMQLDVSDFKGPLDLFARGMVGKRVLPLYAAGTTAFTVDRTLGGMVNGEDQTGETVYSPLIMGQIARGVVEGQALAAGITPGGMSYSEKKEQLVEGEVPIRQGRFWPLGNTPFEGGKVMYYRPSWYKKLQGGALFTSDTYGSPMEKFLFYNDISPLRPLDPYRFERKHYQDRPYPVTGEYFSGPFGPITPIANATIGKLLKPQLRMHGEETAAGLANYVRAGEFGAFDASAYMATGTGGFGYGGGVSGGAVIAGSVGAGSGPGGFGIGQTNAALAANAGSRNLAAGRVRAGISDFNAGLVNASYGPPKVSGIMQPNLVAAGAPIGPESLSYQAGEIGYRIQEMAGIYGFGFASMREAFGFGEGDFEPQRSVLQSASKAYGSSRSFWDLNLGGLGDVPLPSRDALGNLEFSEIVRRFVPKDRKGIDYINPIANTMGMEHPFLPGADYFTNFKTGDPFTKVQEGEIRLPGVGYERFNQLYGDEINRYGPVNQLDILADVAPYSKQFKTLNRQIDKMGLSPEERIKVQEIRSQVETTTRKYDFEDYKYKGSSPGELGISGTQYAIGRVGEYIAHTDNFIVHKFGGKRTAIEDWERRNVYGATFPEWSRPYEGFIEPMVNRATQRNPIVAGAALATAGALFARTPRARLFGSVVGGTVGVGASLVGNISEMVTGDRFLPQQRKQELALEEYTDILSYVKNTKLAAEAQAAGDGRAAVQFRMAAKRTMYGADIYGGDIDTLALAVPKRKREHFKAMIGAPVEDRERILSTAGRLERRIYQAAWGMRVEKRPELQEYFERHELPDASWEGWHPNTNLDHVKIKMGQSMGLEMSQMGYYPQQIKQANLANPSYPEIFGGTRNNSMLDNIRQMMSSMGLSGSVTPVMTPFGSDQVNVYAGVG